jgi:hypothetical protein
MDNSNEVVNPELTTGDSEVVNTQEQQPVVTEDTTKPAQAGEKTDPNLLLKSLQEERERRRLAEEKAKLLEEQLTSSTPSDEVFSDEGKALKSHISSIESKLEKLEEEKQLEKIYSQFPDLKSLASEFDTYKQDYPRHKLENVAKLFLSEKGLMESPRKGLEKTTGGTRQPISSTMTSDEVKTLRTTNYKKYQDMLMKGLIKL